MGLFAFSAWHLYQKQAEKYTFLSFRVAAETGAVMIPNLDRLCTKIESPDELLLPGLPTELTDGIRFLIAQKNFLFDEALSRDCFVSYNATDFCIAFRSAEDADYLADLLTGQLEIPAEAGENSLQVAGKNYFVNHYNDYLVVSTQVIAAQKKSTRERFGNADFIEYTAQLPQGTRHIISKGFHHKVWEDSLRGPVGKPQRHESFLNYVPASFNTLHFYGSTRMQTDQDMFFTSPNEGSLKWVDGGIIIIRKDSFCLMIAPQNLEQDLGLMLEEQTLANENDTVMIPFFNIGPFEVMPFTTVFNWTESIAEVDEPFRYYTTLENYNIVSNSIPAMRWYLGELQLGNLFLKNPRVSSVYHNTVPQRAHYFSMQRDAGGEFILNSKTWRSAEVCVNTNVDAGSMSATSDAVELLAGFEIEIVPQFIQEIHSGDSVFILVSDASHLLLYDSAGMKRWRIDLSTAAQGKPQVIDLENDGSDEIVIFQANQFDVLDISGHSTTGFPKKLNANSKGGLAVNYDNGFNYRFLVSTGTQVKSYDETGNVVDGWMFNGMSAEMSGAISYYTADGKDLITFKDLNKNQYVLNRRGESRLTKIVRSDLPNETGFVVGNFDNSSLRKLGYSNNYIYNQYLVDGQKDSVKLDKEVFAIRVSWLFNNNQPLLVIEEIERVVIFDAFGYEKNSVLKPAPSAALSGVFVNEDFNYVFTDNSQNSLYLLNGYGKMMFPVPVKGGDVFLVSGDLLYTFSGTTIKLYRTGLAF